MVPVAVVGLAALMPGSRDVAEFWRNIVTGRDLITDVPATHWPADDFYDPDPDAPDKTYCRRGAFLPDIDFDPLAHGLPPATLPALDPAQLLGLVVADELLADLSAGLAGPLDRERVSVIIGSSTLSRVGTMDARIQRPVWRAALREEGIDDATAEAVCDRIAARYVPWQEATFPGLLSNVVAGRIANRLDMHGTNCTVDAACASSLAALSAGVNELALHQADLVLTGGVDATNNPLMYVCFSKTPALSPTGDVRPFADDADGTMLGEGVAMIGLKRLADAERDGDRVYAVIRGIGSSSDGRGGAIYAPMPDGQVRALRRAYEAAGYGPETVQLVEAHGTATRAGDEAEFESLCQVFGGRRAEAQWCALGTVKSQIGHTKAAAGAAGLVKAVLALHHKVLPPTIKVTKPNAGLGVDSSPFYLNTAARPWTRPADHRRRASVSSFGFGGTNFHVALEEHDAWARFWVTASELVLLSGRSPHGLGEFDATAPVRLAVVADESGSALDEATARIDRAPDEPFTVPGRICYDCRPADPGRIAFLFPGQGAQYVGMGADVAMAFPQAQDVWDGATAFGLHDVVFPPPVFTDDDRAAAARHLTDTRWAQPALAAHSLSLLALLTAVGIEPACVAGHSLGELVALHAAGAFDAETLLRLARYRGELMAGASGTMLAVAADAATVTEAVDGTTSVWLANVNAPRQTVVSGTAEAIDALAERLSGNGITTRRLDVSAAFHSPLMTPVNKPLGRFLAELPLAAPKIDVYGNADAGRYDRDPEAVRARLAEHSTSPVRFRDQIEAMYADGVRTFIEVGAGSTLTGLVGQTLGDRDHLAVSLDKRGRDGVTAWHEALAQLAVRGVPVDTAALSRHWVSPPRRPPGRMSVTINGTGYPSPVVTPAPRERTVMPDSRAPEPNGQWLATVQELQRQTAEAHMHFQQVLGEAHREFLRMAENTFGTFATPGTYTPPEPIAYAPPEPMASLPLPPPPPPVIAPPPPPPPPPVPAPVAVQPDALDLGLLLDVVADKTGYPVDMLGGGMDLEADLGIDSIKKVEIFAAVRQRVAGMPSADSPQMARLFQLRTLDQIVRWAQDGHEDTGPPVRRSAVRPIAAPPCGLAMAGLTRAPLTVVDGGSGLAAAVAEQLAAHDITAVTADFPEPDAWGVILLHGMAEQPADLAAFQAARTVADHMTEHGGVFVTVQDTGGCFGLLNPARADFGGLAALARTAALEWPLAAVRAIDCQRGDHAAKAIVDELLTGGGTRDVGLRTDGTRWTIVEEDADGTRAEPVVTADSVIVATGGARGVTAAALLGLAARRPRMVLIGRTPLTEEPAFLSAAHDEASLIRLLPRDTTPAHVRARAILAAREVRTNVAALERAGATVRYACLDVTDGAALNRELDQVRREWGPITALVHGAGVLADKRIADKTDEQFDLVYRTKVDGWHALLAATESDPLTVICAFSSVAARLGNPGQSDYAMANETLNHLAAAERARRPACRVRSLGWGPWQGGMVTPSLAAHFAQRGVPLIPLDAGARAFTADIDAPDDTVQVLLGAGTVTAPPRCAVDITVDDRTHPYLLDHAPAGTPVLPLAMAVEWFAAAGRSAYPNRETNISDIQVLHRVDLPDLAAGHRFTIDGDRLVSASGVAHYRARLTTPNGRTRPWTPATGTYTGAIYDHPALFHGPRFRTLRRVDALSDAGADARVVGLRDMSWPGDRWWTDPAAVDGALQLAVLWASHAIGRATLPMGVDTVRVHRSGPASGSLRCLVRAGAVAGEQVTCDVLLLDEDGQPRAELLGVNLISRPDQASG